MLRLFKMEPFLLEYLKLYVYLCFLSNYKVLLNYYALKNIGEKTRSLLLNKYLFCEAVKKTKNICSVQFSQSVMSDSLRPHESQHARPLCPSPAPRVYSNSCPLSQWCHPTISSSVVPFSSLLQSFPASGFFF